MQIREPRRSEPAEQGGFVLIMIALLVLPLLLLAGSAMTFLNGTVGCTTSPRKLVTGIMIGTKSFSES